MKYQPNILALKQIRHRVIEPCHYNSMVCKPFFFKVVIDDKYCIEKKTTTKHLCILHFNYFNSMMIFVKELYIIMAIMLMPS